MTGPLDVLARFPSGEGASAVVAWNRQVEESLRGPADEWLAAVDADTDGGQAMTPSMAWSLHGWVEQTASLVGRERRSDLVGLSAFALSLLGSSPLDVRESWLVGSLLRRACDHVGLPFGDLVRDGCRRAGEPGRACETWLLDVSATTPSSHREVRDADGGLGFERVPTSIDVARLERWAAGDVGTRGQP